ncbi:hypothetical protein B0H14DRAFT_438165 [Mycena olivaceomarginata]|nr:hypothetical protein B0H14DRAFT_438165 [Mycena olivaceomarginata]
MRSCSLRCWLRGGGAESLQAVRQRGGGGVLEGARARRGTAPRDRDLRGQVHDLLFHLGFRQRRLQGDRVHEARSPLLRRRHRHLPPRVHPRRLLHRCVVRRGPQARGLVRVVFAHGELVAVCRGLREGYRGRCTPRPDTSTRTRPSRRLWPPRPRPPHSTPPSTRTRRRLPARRPSPPPLRRARGRGHRTSSPCTLGGRSTRTLRRRRPLVIIPRMARARGSGRRRRTRTPFTWRRTPTRRRRRRARAVARVILSRLPALPSRLPVSPARPPDPAHDHAPSFLDPPHARMYPALPR